MSTLIGQSLGRYQILEQLGEGGMATVYKAYDTLLERNVAIKVIRADQFPPAMLTEMMRRFEREAKALAKLSHPNIVHVHDYGEYGGAPYLVMEYLPSGTLKLRPDNPVPWPQAIKTLLPIAQALAYAHENNIIHRDIKPANILMTDKGLPMLSDFGIAKIISSNPGATLTGAGMSVGTPEYMAPEQWVGESGPQSDIYALGVVLFELVTGRKPYVADTPAGIMLKQVNDPLPRPSQFVAGLPEGLENVLLKALQRQPEDRYHSMSEFAEAMEELLQGQTGITPVRTEDDLAGKTMLAGGSPSQIGQPPTPTSKTGIPVNAGSEVKAIPKKQKQLALSKGRRWTPLGIAGALLCIGLVAGVGFAIRGLRGRLPTGSGQPTTPSGSLPTQLLSEGPAGKIKVLWDTAHGPRTDSSGSPYTPDGMYKSLTQVLADRNIVVTGGDLSNLGSNDVLVVAETSVSSAYTSAEMDQIEQFVRSGGHGLVILTDTPELENLADGLTKRFSISLGEVISPGPATFSSEPFFSGVSTVDFGNSGGVFQVTTPSQSASLDKNGNSVIAFCQCDSGRVLAIADTNLWDNNGLGTGDNQSFAVNVFQWLAKVIP